MIQGNRLRSTTTPTKSDRPSRHPCETRPWLRESCIASGVKEPSLHCVGCSVDHVVVFVLDVMVCSSTLTSNPSSGTGWESSSGLGPDLGPVPTSVDAANPPPSIEFRVRPEPASGRPVHHRRMVVGLPMGCFQVSLGGSSLNRLLNPADWTLPVRLESPHPSGIMTPAREMGRRVRRKNPPTGGVRRITSLMTAFSRGALSLSKAFSCCSVGSRDGLNLSSNQIGPQDSSTKHASSTTSWTLWFRSRQTATAGVVRRGLRR